MVKIYEPLPLRDDYTIDVGNWIERLPVSEDSVKLINTACQFASVIGEDHLTRYGIFCKRFGNCGDFSEFAI